MSSNRAGTKSSLGSANREQTSGHSNGGTQNRSTDNSTTQTTQSNTGGMRFVNPISSTMKALTEQPTVNGKDHIGQQGQYGMDDSRQIY
jgi:hypothetical protein